MRKVHFLVIFLLLAALILGFSPSLAATGDPVLINEVLASHTGTDDTEFIEFYGIPGTSLDGYSLIVVESDAFAPGTIDRQLDFGPSDILGPNGFYLIGNPVGLGANYGVIPNVDVANNYLENSSLTVALVQTASISGGSVTGSEVVLDAVALTDGDAGDTFFFGAPVIGPDGSNFPAGVHRLVDGVDTDTAADWAIGDFFLGSGNTPTAGDGTPPPPPPPDLTIYDIQYTPDPGGDSPYAGQTVTTQGVVTAFFYASGNRYTFVQDGSGAWNGIMLYKPDGYVNVGDLITITGDVSEYYGLTQFYKPVVAVLSSGNPLPSPAVLASGDVSQEQWESVFVRITNVTVIDDDLGHGEWLADDGSGGAIVDDLGDYSYSPQNGDTLAYIQGPVNYSYYDFKIEPRNDGDILQAVTIPEIQGTGLFSPFDGSYVQTYGIVTQFSKTGKDFWLQDPLGDGDPTSSDGIYVYKGVNSTAGVTPQIGDYIRIVAKVDEYYQLTELKNVKEIEIISSGNPLPEPFVLADLPNESIPDSIALWESLEGMLVSVPYGKVVSGTNYYGEFLMVSEADSVPGSGYFPQTKRIIIRSLGDNQVDYNPENIMVDDFTYRINVMAGDEIYAMLGVVDYNYSYYKIQPISHSENTHKLPKPPVSTRSGDKADLAITTFNVENLFDLLDEPGKNDEGSTPSPAELETKLAKLVMAVEIELELPAILIVQEVENTAILQELGDRINAATGTDYVATSFETSDVRGIEAGFLWDANRVTLLDAFQLSGPDVEAAFGPSSPSPGREPIVGVFDVNGMQITIVGNHFKSKGGDDPLYGTVQPPVRATEIQRKAQAQVVRDYVNSILDADPNALVLVAGDLNDFQFGEPGEGADHPLAILEGGEGEVPLTNLIYMEKGAERYTYTYNGNSQVLDHILVSPSLFEYVAAVDILHLNAGFPAYLEDDASTPIASSDHDPVEARFRFK
jgi:predicted extracellular nuclease